MKFFILLWLLVAPAAVFSATEILNLPHKAATLPNGLRVVLVKYPSPGVVSFQLSLPPTQYNGPKRVAFYQEL